MNIIGIRKQNTPDIRCDKDIRIPILKIHFVITELTPLNTVYMYISFQINVPWSNAIMTTKLHSV